ncbi:hypothetical protein LCGC14_2378470 [marine sediment metagenome]|uniref:Glycosyltransferase 2-like domain-containing protein n=1 Tax=marine sediment metagenome TaxID=412755 RepID=A0A0F9C1M1_9ZZZZ
MIAIVMCTHNGGEHIKHAIASIIGNTKYPYKLIIVESESTDGTDKICDAWAESHKNVEVYHTKKEGLIKAMNFGIKKAGKLDVYLTQDDVIIPNLYNRDWLETLVKVSQMDKCGLVTTIQGGGISGPDYIEGLQWAGTWSLFIPYSTREKIGLFDEEFNPGCGDDIDYCYRVYQRGLMLYQANFWVDHHRQGEHFNEDEQMKKEHALYFRKKHKLGEFAPMQGTLK